MKTVAEAEFGEEYVANIVRNALGVLAHLGGQHLGPQGGLAFAPGYGPPMLHGGREVLLTWKWNKETQRPSVHARVVELPAPDPEIARKIEDDRQVKMVGRMAKQFKGGL